MGRAATPNTFTRSALESMSEFSANTAAAVRDSNLTTSNALLAYRAADPIEARALAARLANEGIEARVLGEPLQGAYGGISVGGLTTAEVWVAEADRGAAQALIAAWREEQQPPEVRQGEQAIKRSMKFQFSMLAILLVMVVVALLVFAAQLGTEVFAEVLSNVVLLFFIILMILGVSRIQARMAKSAQTDDLEL